MDALTNLLMRRLEDYRCFVRRKLCKIAEDEGGSNSIIEAIERFSKPVSQIAAIESRGLPVASCRQRRLNGLPKNPGSEAAVGPRRSALPPSGDDCLINQLFRFSRRTANVVDNVVDGVLVAPQQNCLGVAAPPPRVFDQYLVGKRLHCSIHMRGSWPDRKVQFVALSLVQVPASADALARSQSAGW